VSLSWFKRLIAASISCPHSANTVSTTCNSKKTSGHGRLTQRRQHNCTHDTATRLFAPQRT
jgi:hypothetical protein